MGLWSRILEEEWQSIENNNWNPRGTFLSLPAKYLRADSIGTAKCIVITLQVLQRRDRSKTRLSVDQKDRQTEEDMTFQKVGFGQCEDRRGVHADANTA